MNDSIKNIRKLSREYKNQDIIEEEDQQQQQLQDMNKEQLIEYVFKIEKKVKDLQSENSVQRSKIWDLRKLIKRIAKEGYSQLIEVEKEKQNVEQNLESLENFYQSLDKNSKLFEQCIAYWQNMIND